MTGLRAQIKKLSPGRQEIYGLNRLSKTYGIFPFTLIRFSTDPHPTTVKMTVELASAEQVLAELTDSLLRIERQDRRIRQREGRVDREALSLPSQGTASVQSLLVRVTKCVSRSVIAQLNVS